MSKMKELEADIILLSYGRVFLRVRVFEFCPLSGIKKRPLLGGWFSSYCNYANFNPLSQEILSLRNCVTATQFPTL